MPAPCPTCGDPRTRSRWTVTDRVYLTTDESFAISECNGCGVFFLDPPPATKDLPRYYPKSFWRVGEDDAPEDARGRLMEWYRRQILRDHAKFVGRIIREQQADGRWRGLLDVGCGDGSTLAAFGCSPCVGLDSSEEAVHHVRLRGIPAVRAVPDAIPLRAKSFSVITMFHFLEHVRPAAPHLESARSLLTEGGELVVQVPNAASLGAAALGERWHGFDPPRHLVNYNPAALRRTIENSGFEVVAENHFCLRDNPATLATSIAPGLYPPARVARGHAKDGLPALLGDLAYLALTLITIPLTYLGSAAGRGESVMMRCRLRDGATSRNLFRSPRTDAGIDESPRGARVKAHES